jgi:hypothetical protein
MHLGKIEPENAETNMTLKRDLACRSADEAMLQSNAAHGRIHIDRLA